MTDDKVPYFHLKLNTGFCNSRCPACAYAEGRQAERERCARIAESWLSSETGERIAEKIRGGQDAK